MNNVFFSSQSRAPGNTSLRFYRFAVLCCAVLLSACGAGDYGNTSSSALPVTVTTFAGTAGSAGSTDGPGTSARFDSPNDVAVDSAGNLYVSDYNSHTIRKITSAGVVSTFAGTVGTSGSTDGPGTSASFNSPYGVAVDSAGNVYVADNNNSTIRKITSAGVVSTFAGTAGSAGSTDGPGTSALFNYPTDVAVDSAGNVYVADQGNHTIRKITSAGVVSTLAGTAGSTGSTDGPGTSALFNYPYGVAVDSTGNLYVTDYSNSTIRKITSAGVVSTLAGTAGSTGTTDGPGTSALFNFPQGITLDSAGNLYVADSSSNTIRKITSAGVVSTLAGTAGTTGSTDGTGTTALFNYPTDVAVDSAGNVYVVDQSNNTIRKIN